MIAKLRVLAILLAAKFGHLVLGFGVTTAVVRIFPPENAGEYFYTVSLGLIFGSLCFGWLQTLYLRFGAGEGRATERDLSGFVWRVLFFGTLLLLILMVLLAPKFIASVAPIQGLFITLVALVFGVQSVLVGLLRIRGEVVRGQLSEFVIRPLAFLLALFFVWRVGVLDYKFGLVAYLIGGCVGIIWLSRSSRTPAVVRDELERKPRIDKEWIRAAPTLIAASVAAVLLNQGDVVLLAQVAGVENVAGYKAAAQLAALCTIGVALANMIHAPDIARSFRSRDTNLFRKSIIFSVVMTGTLGGTVGALLLIFGAELLPFLFGETYRGFYPILAILVLGRVVDSICGPLTNIAAMTGNQRFTIWSMLIALAVLIGLGIPLIYRFGAIGLAVSSATAVATWNVVLAALLFHKLRRIAG